MRHLGISGMDRIWFFRRGIPSRTAFTIPSLCPSGSRIAQFKERHKGKPRFFTVDSTVESAV